jgi:hypothetical protein
VGATRLAITCPPHPAYWWALTLGDNVQAMHLLAVPGVTPGVRSGLSCDPHLCPLLVRPATRRRVYMLVCHVEAHQDEIVESGRGGKAIPVSQNQERCGDHVHVDLGN